MRILIACESSGVEREAFRAVGHDVLSCDLLRSLSFSGIAAAMADQWGGPR